MVRNYWYCPESSWPDKNTRKGHFQVGLHTVCITVTAIQFTGQYSSKYLRDGTVQEYGHFVWVICDSDDIHYQACFWCTKIISKHFGVKLDLVHIY